MENCSSGYFSSLEASSIQYGSKTKQLINEQDEAFFMVNLDEVVRRHALWKKLLPRVEPHYAVKCNNDPVLLELLCHLGTGFDCSSKIEMEQVIQVGASPSNIVYAHPCKQVSFLRYAWQMTIDLMTFDSESELHKIKIVYPDARLLIRVLPPSELKSVIPLGQKFGCHHKYVSKLFEEAKLLKLNIVGISFHVGSMCSDETAFVDALEMAREIFDIGIREGFEMNLLDIGGGFPGYNTESVTMEKICNVLEPTLEKYFPLSAGVRIIAEPGRFYAAAAFTLYVSVIGKKVIYDDEASCKNQTENKNKSILYYINDGLFGAFHVDWVLTSINRAREKRIPVIADSQRYVNKPVYKSSVWGPTCCPTDCVISDISLPELSIGDWLMFSNMGAYTKTLSSHFNGMPKARIHYTKDTADCLEP